MVFLRFSKNRFIKFLRRFENFAKLYFCNKKVFQKFEKNHPRVLSWLSFAKKIIKIRPVAAPLALQQGDHTPVPPFVLARRAVGMAYFQRGVAVSGPVESRLKDILRSQKRFK